MKLNTQDLVALVRKKFESQSVVLPLWQTLAGNFYPERADFTLTRNMGSELADDLISSYPILTRRDLGNSLSSMLRDGQWFKMNVEDSDQEGKGWLDWATKRQFKHMNNVTTGFVNATKQADHDYVTFGQFVMSIEPNRNYDGILYRTWHLRDCAYWEDETGQVSNVVRKWKASLMTFVRHFGEDKLHHKMVEQYGRSGGKLKEAELYHAHILNDEYGGDDPRRFASVWVDPVNMHIIEEVFMDRRHYVVPRFQTISGSPYAYSPATIVALPDARMLQAMSHTLLEAGERYARPPLIAAGGKAISSAIDLGPDGVTWFDKEYDTKTGEALKQIYQNSGSYPIGLELRDEIRDILASCFYTNKLSLPEVTRDMTAYEVEQRMKQFRRETLPLFSPIEYEYNGQVCETTFDLELEMNMLGSPYDIPESLSGADVEFKFQSPLTEAEEEQKVYQFNNIGTMLREVADVDADLSTNMDFDTAFRSAVEGMGAPADWLRPVQQALDARNQRSESRAAMVEEQQVA